jgi:GNAT superfamily N-acetyltransferase
MAEWVRVSEKGFGQELDSFYPAYARHGYVADAFSVHYTGYLANIPVTSGTLFDCGGSAAIYDVSTPPAFRRLGLGSAITSFLLQEIRNRGYSDTWIWSSDLAKSVYQGLGFVETDFGMREHTWHRYWDIPDCRLMKILSLHPGKMIGEKGIRNAPLVKFALRIK